MFLTKAAASTNLIGSIGSILFVVIIWILVITLIVRTVKKFKANEQRKLKLIEEQNQLLRQLADEQSQDKGNAER